MAFNDIGVAKSSAGATLSITCASAISSGQVIVVGVGTGGAGSSSLVAGVVTDTAGNTYIREVTLATTGGAQIRRGALFYTFNSIALASGNTITITCSVATAGIIMSACGSSQARQSPDPKDSAVTASTNGNSSLPSITSGVPTENEELFFGMLVFQTDLNIGTNPSGWVTPPTSIASTAGTNVAFFGGNLTNNSVAALTYNPTLSSANFWTAFVVGFRQHVKTSSFPNYPDQHRAPISMVSY